jgi:hypothetical protein
VPKIGIPAYRRRRVHLHKLGLRRSRFLENVATFAELRHKDLHHLNLAQQHIASLAAKELKVSRPDGEGILKDLGALREFTGRGRYQALEIRL